MPDHWLWLAKGFAGLVSMMQLLARDLKPSEEAMRILKAELGKLKELVGEP